MLLMTKERQPTGDPEPILSLEDVAQRLGLSRDTVTRLMKQGKLRYKRVGRVYRFREQWIHDYMESEEEPPKS